MIVWVPRCVICNVPESFLGGPDPRPWTCDDCLEQEKVEVPLMAVREMNHDEWISEAVRRFGRNPREWKFKCVRCGEIQTMNDLIEAGVPEGDVERYMGFSCIGRWDSERGCDWTLGGLLTMHTLEVITEDGPRPCFEFADEEGADAGGPGKTD